MTQQRLTVASLGVGVIAGLVGTACMTITLWAEKRVRKNLTRPVDYDASSHVITAASTVLRWTPVTAGQRRALFLLVHWGYGSATGAAYPLLRRVTGSRRAAAFLFYGSCQMMAMTLFPTAGKTPPPWRWRADTVASSLVQHAIYAATVAAVDDRLHLIVGNRSVLPRSQIPLAAPYARPSMPVRR